MKQTLTLAAAAFSWLGLVAFALSCEDAPTTCDCTYYTEQGVVWAEATHTLCPPEAPSPRDLEVELCGAFVCDCVCEQGPAPETCEVEL